MHFTHLLLLAGTAAALAFPGGESQGCCCCDLSRGAIVCNPNIPADDCFCTLAMCPEDAPTITEALPKPTPPASYPSEPEKDEKRQYGDLSTPLPPPGQEWCCCCNGKDYVCAARPKGSLCICPAIACPEGAKTIYPSTRPDRPGRPEARNRPERPGRPGRSDRPGRPERPSV